MDKGLTAPKWVLIVWPKIPQTHQNLSAQFVCPSPKILNFNEKRLNWASVVRDREDTALNFRLELSKILTFSSAHLYNLRFHRITALCCNLSLFALEIFLGRTSQNMRVMITNPSKS
jgi:hypothetical protein